MIHLLNKSIRTGLCIITLLLFTSYRPVNDSGNKSEFLKTSYTLTTTGDYSLELQGEFYFETTLETSGKGTKFSVLKLGLKSDENQLPYTMEFLISQRNRSNEISSGVYRVNNDIDGFLNYFDGVFGFADIQEKGALPFFTKKGKVVILRKEQDKLWGIMEITLRNEQGKQINISGNFSAIQKD
ncbi:hypothetical protein [Spongiimicrobium sp. 3-5]|uniref:hypothetical protein n=1 Tax=Spongiimicrobium sp. 3-5 TaxID=3332596 RepID=UPI00397EA5A6